MTMHAVVTGSSGLVGSALVQSLTSAGHHVTRLVRRPAGSGEIQWDPTAAGFDAGSLAGIDAVVHLAGENIAAQRWTAAFKQRIRASRVQGTQALCQSLAASPRPPRVLVSASATGFYGDRGTEALDEQSSAGRGFLADTCREWEAATRPAQAAGIRVVLLRFGMILSARGGALAQMLLPFRLGLGGRVGDGEQIWSWIGLPDAVRAIRHCLTAESLSGPVNVVAPEPVANREFTRVLARVLHRPAWMPVPAFAVRWAFGEMADELLLSSARVQPRQLLESGFAFGAPTLSEALQESLRPGNPRPA
jgi:uncharacterized protein (TIGR01777 family)